MANCHSFRGTRVSIAVAALLAGGVLFGCAAGGKPGQLPLGQWSGDGQFVFEEWKEDKPPQSIYRRYPTTLRLERGVLEGRDVIELEIRSDRGELPGLGSETHLVGALVEAKRVSGSMVLYRFLGLEFNPEPGTRLSVDEGAPPVSAVCSTEGGVTVFEVAYMEQFIDTFRFQGNRLEKVGVYTDPKEGLVHWVERLRRE